MFLTFTARSNSVQRSLISEKGLLNDSLKSFQTHFPHFLDVCLSTLLVFFLAIQGIQAAKLRLLFASHTDLWWCLSHWVSLLHRSWFQDQSSAEKAKEILTKLPTYPLVYERLSLRQPWCDTSQWNLSISATQNACRYWRQWHTSKLPYIARGAKLKYVKNLDRE